MEALGAKRCAARADVDREDWSAIDSWIAATCVGLDGLTLKSIAELGGALLQALPRHTAFVYKDTGASTGHLRVRHNIVPCSRTWWRAAQASAPC